MTTIWLIAARNLVFARRRTMLLGTAIALVAALFVTLRAVSVSVSARMIASATTLSAGHINVGGFFKLRRKGSDPILSERDRLMAFIRQKVPEATAVIDRHRGWGRLISPASSLNAGLSGIVLADETRFFQTLRLAAEKEYKPGGSDAIYGRFADLAEPGTVLIFAAQAKKLEVGVGDTITMVTEASGGQANTIDLRVAAIASDLGFMSNFNVFARRETVLELYKLGADTTGVIMVYLQRPDMASNIMQRLAQDLTQAGWEVMEHDPRPFFTKFSKVVGEDWLGQRLDLTIWSDEIAYVLWISRALDLVSFFVLMILAVIIIGGVSNAMVMSVRERTREIGTMRAIGAQREFVAAIFLCEALLLGFLSALAGSLVAVLGWLGINALYLPITNAGIRTFLLTNTLAVDVHVLDVLITLSLFTIITGFAALWPAIKAARLQPVAAMQATK